MSKENLLKMLEHVRKIEIECDAFFRVKGESSWYKRDAILDEVRKIKILIQDGLSEC